MTQDEILAMQPGPELNRQVAETVFGHVVSEDEVFGTMERILDAVTGYSWAPLQPYSEDVTIAEAVVDRMVESGFEDAIYWADFGGGKYTEAEAICKAALSAVCDRRVDQVSDDILKQALGGDEKGET